jgi:thiamine biosynthesis protein ThiS
MIKIVVNHEVFTVPQESNLNDALKLLGFENGYFAVAVNRKVIAKDLYQQFLLQADDHIDIVAPMQGG